MADYYMIEFIIVLSVVLIYAAAKLISLVLGRVRVQTIFATLMTIILLPLLIWLLGNQIGNYESQPTAEDSKRLGEMTVKVLHSADYKKRVQQETLYSIVPSVSRYNRPSKAYIYEIYVYTDKDTYIFTCDESTFVQTPTCAHVGIGGWAGAYEYSKGDTYFKDYKGFKKTQD